ncbi:PLP-dependent aminotransferase family protein, partial [Pelomonas sp. HMWF004]
MSQAFPKITLDRGSAKALFAQLHEALRDAILGGTIQPGMRLPPTREFAQALGISRQSVVTAYDQLTIDGYIVGHVGRGSFVSTDLKSPSVARKAGVHAGPVAMHRLPSLRGSRYLPPSPASQAAQGAPRAFRTGAPATEAFPYSTWSRIEGSLWRRRPEVDVDAAGFAPLRRHIAQRLRSTRGMDCDAEQIVITSGTQQGLHLAATLLLDPGDAVWMEDPGYRWAAACLAAAGASLCPVAIDEQGLRVADGIARCPSARLAYVTPSHQFPLGATMSLVRRMELLAWARRERAWIVEDDYDSEYRYDSPVLSSLQSMDKADCVLLLGSFSKVLFPALQLGFAVLPKALVEPFRRVKTVVDRRTAAMPQRVLADFIEQGHFQRHVKRTRSLYQERREFLVDLVRQRLSGGLRLGPCHSGMQLALAFSDSVDDVAFANLAANRGLSVLPLSVCYAPAATGSPTDRSGLVL